MQRFNLTRIGFPILWTVWLVLTAWTNQAISSENGVPSWQQGVSTFDGNDYQLPSQSSVPARVTTPSDFYTMPVGPTQQIQAVAGYNQYDALLNSPTLEPPILSDAPSDNFSDILGGESSSIEPGLNSPVLSDPVIPGPSNADAEADRAVIGSGAVDDSGTSDADGTEGLADHLNAQLDSATVTGPAPLDEEVIRWYQYPRRWTKGWDSHAEIGLDGSDGNAETLAIQTGLETKRKTELYTFELDVDYRQASSRGVTTEDNGRLNLDHDRMMGESAWAVFGKLGLEWDRFKAFNLRVALNGGVGYYWVRNDTATLITRVGAGSSREHGAPIDEWVAESVYAVEAERQLTERQKLKGKLNYFPSWVDSSDFRVVADASWEILLDGSKNFSLKLSVTDRYDSTPQGALPNDFYYTLLLLYKF